LVDTHEVQAAARVAVSMSLASNSAEPRIISSADDLTKTGKSGDIELDEEELKRVSGGQDITINIGRSDTK
jgi:hypothetical protein